MKGLTTFVLLLTLCCTSAIAQTDNNRDIRMLMAQGKRHLANHDTVAAITEFKKVLEMAPNETAAKNLIASLEKPAEAKTTVAAALPVVAAALPDTASTKKRSRFSRFVQQNVQQNTATTAAATAVAAAITADEPAEPKAEEKKEEKPVYDNPDDDVLRAYLVSLPRTEPVFRFTKKPIAPLASRLAKQEGDGMAQGKWVSSLHGGKAIPKQMFTFEYNKAGNLANVDINNSAIAHAFSKAGADLALSVEVSQSGKLQINGGAQYSATNRDDAERFMNQALAPFFDEAQPYNLDVYRWMKAGTLHRDTIVNETVIYDTIQVKHPRTRKMTIEVKDSVVRDTTINEYYVVDDSYPISVNIQLTAHPTHNVLHGTLSVNATISREKETLTLASVDVPCTFYNVGDSAYWQEGDVSRRIPTVAATYDFDGKLASLFNDRLMQQGKALAQSAAMMMNTPNPNKEQAKEWYGKAVLQDNSNAMMMLGQMALDESADDAAKEEAATHFQRALNSGDVEGAYRIALIQLDNNLMSQAYSYAMEAARNGSTNAMLMLAEMYFTGIGVRENAPKAMTWLKRADAELRHNR